jgi:uncharacterized damage-inducible protein DinB
VMAARASMKRISEALASVPDAAMERPWRWQDDDADVRYGAYRCYELIEGAGFAVARRLAAGAYRSTAAQPIVAAATAARWDLHGILVPLGDDDLDRDPGGGEWTLRQTLGHIVNVQRAYAWFTAWWLARRDADDFPKAVPDDVDAELPTEEAEGEGSLADIRARLDAVLDLAAGRFAGVDDAGLAVRARWAGFPVTVGFRLARWSSHLREHTVQVEKTLALLGRAPTEADRLVGLVVGAYGRTEERVFGVPSEALVADATGTSPDGIIAEACATAARHADEVAAAATSA